MEENTHSKIRELFQRPFSSLPCAEDLPRLIPGMIIRIKRKGDKDYKMIYGDKVNPEQTHQLRDILAVLSDILSEVNLLKEQDKFNSTLFDKVFFGTKPTERRASASKDPLTNVDETSKGNLPHVTDKRLENALKWLPHAFLTDSDAEDAGDESIFHFHVSNPDVLLQLIVDDQKMEIRSLSGKDDKDFKTPDCNINCASAILSSILTGYLKAAVAMQGGHLKVDNMQELMKFGNSFDFDREEFDRWSKSNNTSSVTLPVLSSQSQSLNHGTINLSIRQYFGQVLGTEHPFVRLLKCCNQAILSPAMIELKLKLGMPFMTKDVANSWHWEILIDPSEAETIQVLSKKKELHIQGLFEYEWHLRLKFDKNYDLLDTDLTIPEIVFREDHKDIAKKEDIIKILNKYFIKTGTASRKNSESGPLSTEEYSRYDPKKYSNGDTYYGPVNQRNQRHGKGLYITAQGDMYVGEFVNGSKHGLGVITMEDGTRYDGEFSDDKPNGNGIYVFSNGDIFKGQFKDDEFHGYGIMSSSDGSWYEGEYCQGLREGRGVLFKGATTYDGQWKNNVFNGWGIYLYATGDVYEGQFENGKPNGTGRYIFARSGRVIEGEFVNGVPKPQNTRAPFESPKAPRKGSIPANDQQGFSPITTDRTKLREWKEENFRKMAEKQMEAKKIEIQQEALHQKLKKLDSLGKKQ